MRRHNQPIMYADANSTVGRVRVFACPHCRDGEVTNRLSEQNKLMRDEMTWLHKELAPGTYWDSELCSAIYAVVKDTLTKVEELEK